MKKCKTCMFYNVTDYKDNPFCSSDKFIKFMTRYDLFKDCSSSIMINTSGSYRIRVGPNFGCIHHEERGEENRGAVKFVSGQYCFHCGVQSVQKIELSRSLNNNFILVCHSCGSKFDIF